MDVAEATELARIRKKLTLTQLEAAHLAGGGKNAFSRHERGHTKPLAAVINVGNSRISRKIGMGGRGTRAGCQ